MNRREFLIAPAAAIAAVAIPQLLDGAIDPFPRVVRRQVDIDNLVTLRCQIATLQLASPPFNPTGFLQAAARNPDYLSQMQPDIFPGERLVSSSWHLSAGDPREAQPRLWVMHLISMRDESLLFNYPAGNADAQYHAERMAAKVKGRWAQARPRTGTDWPAVELVRWSPHAQIVNICDG